VRSRTRAEWQELLLREDIPAEIVLSAAEARAHPQARDRGLLTEAPDTLPRLAFPARLDGARPKAGEHVPVLGEHTEPVLEELGLEEMKREIGVGKRFSWRRMLARWMGR
jgi:formyl-CoA transferase